MNFEFETTRAYLIAKREFYGADTPIGHRCSNIIELWQNRRNATGEHNERQQEVRDEVIAALRGS